MILQGMPPRTGKSYRTNLLTELNIPKITLKNYIGKVDTERLMRDINYQALDNMVKAMKEVEPDVPDEVLRAFVITYMELEVVTDYDIKTQEHKITCIPLWKDTSMIDRDSKEYKLLDEYIWSQ